jgi:hypothetical protein
MPRFVLPFCRLRPGRLTRVGASIHMQRPAESQSLLPVTFADHEHPIELSDGPAPDSTAGVGRVRRTAGTWPSRTERAMTSTDH